MTILTKDLGRREYLDSYKAMRDFTEVRDAHTPDEIWLLEHSPVYTLGLAAKEEHLLNTRDIPVIKTDRGGQVTYHGPGQLVVYLMLDLYRRSYAIKELVMLIEQSIIDFLSDKRIYADRLAGAPGVYINNEKIAALGVRVKNNKTYHGLALNVDMDLTPFTWINPCGYKNLKCTSLKKHVSEENMDRVKAEFPNYLLKHLDNQADALSDVA